MKLLSAERVVTDYLKILFILLFRPKNAQYIGNNVCFVKYSDMYRYIDLYLSSSGSLFLYTLKLQNQLSNQFY